MAIFQGYFFCRRGCFPGRGRSEHQKPTAPLDSKKYVLIYLLKMLNFSVLPLEKQNKIKKCWQSRKVCLLDFELYILANPPPS